MPIDNPYAPPKTDLDLSEPRPRIRSARRDDSVEEALVRLEEHLADPVSVAADRALIGPRVRLRTQILVGVSLASAALVMGLALTLGGSKSIEVALAISAIVLLVALILTGVFLVHDLTLVRRDGPMTADRAVKGMLQALRFGRFDYAVACLSPTARETPVEAPDFAPVVTGIGRFTLQTADDVKRYAQTFCRPGHNQIHMMRVKRIGAPSEQGDVAVVDVELEMQSLPRWAYIVSVVAFVAVRIVGVVVGLVLYFSLRKTRSVTVQKTLLRGSNGAYYLLRPGIEA